MRLFADEHPEIELTLAVGNRHEVLELNHSVDVAISGKPPADYRLFAEPSTNEIVCITAPDDPAMGQARLEAVKLGGRRWLLREPGSGRVPQ